jgi:hypothetical protein
MEPHLEWSSSTPVSFQNKIKIIQAFPESVPQIEPSMDAGLLDMSRTGQQILNLPGFREAAMQSSDAANMSYKGKCRVQPTTMVLSNTN